MKAKNRVLFVLIILTFVLVTSSWQDGSAHSQNAQIQGTILYVKPGATGTCTSWQNACDLRIALGDTYLCDQIWVAAGTYYPSVTNNRLETFQLRIHVAVYGGFAGTETSLDQRDLENNLTILSGDIGIPNNNSDNSYHVVTGSAMDGTAVLDGFYIRDGNANGTYPQNYGGGILNFIGSPTLRNVLFYQNTAESGGGAFTYQGNPVFTNVVFLENTGLFFGGGMYNHTSSPIFDNNVIIMENTARMGGGMYNDRSNFLLSKVTFLSNNTSSYSNGCGGGIYNDQSSPTIVNSTFAGNSAWNGGGIYNSHQSNPNLTNVTFVDNTADLTAANGGGIFSASACSATIRNSILWGNTPDQISGSATATYSDIQAGFSGTGNIDQNPNLPPLVYDGDYLVTQPLMMGSPAIDAGDPELCPVTDQRGFPRPIDGDGDGIATCDMGSYEYEFTPTRTFLPAILR